uniref:F-box domain-containing protein n=1 Tax=Acrobeloides nanus TaxID=290746 RepID=A0A914EA52_9BILA
MNIPQELFCDILQFFDRNEVEKCQLICQKWNTPIQNNWKTLPLWYLNSLEITALQWDLSRNLPATLTYRKNGHLEEIDPTEEEYIGTIKSFKHATFHLCNIPLLNENAIMVMRRVEEDMGGPIKVETLYINSLIELKREVLENYINAQILDIDLTGTSKIRELDYLLKNSQLIHIPSPPNSIKIHLDSFSKMDNELFHFISFNDKTNEVKPWEFTVNGEKVFNCSEEDEARGFFMMKKLRRDENFKHKI